MTLKHIFFPAFCVGISVILANAITWNDCGSKGYFSSVTILGCESSPMCDLPKGSNVSLVVGFRPNTQITKATAAVHGIIAGVSLPFPLHNSDGCEDSGLECPLVGGESYNYANSFYVPEDYPKVKLVLECELVDQDGDHIWCIEVPAQIVDPYLIV